MEGVRELHLSKGAGRGWASHESFGKKLDRHCWRDALVVRNVGAGPGALWGEEWGSGGMGPTQIPDLKMEGAVCFIPADPLQAEGMRDRTARAPRC